jgi:hypothetical protein
MFSMQCITALLNDQTFLNALGAAVGGFLGVVVFFLVRLGIEKLRARPKLLRSYSCAHDQNVGDANEYEGQVMHHHGKRLTDKTDLKKIGKNAPVWEWTRSPCGKGQGDTVIYGPYTTDFSEPGEYEVSFSVRAIGIPKRSELSHDPIILEFDVTRTSTRFVPAPTQSGVITFSPPISVSKHFVRASDLEHSRWVDVPLRFYATGEGVWEYRVFAYDGASKVLNHLGHFGENIRLFFDKISIRRIRKMVLPWD